jgi:hypothetical protein
MPNSTLHLGIFYMPQIYDMGPPALLLLRRKAPWKIRRLQPGLNPRTWVLEASTLTLDHRSRSAVRLQLSTKDRGEIVSSILLPNPHIFKTPIYFVTSTKFSACELFPKPKFIYFHLKSILSLSEKFVTDNQRKSSILSQRNTLLSKQVSVFIELRHSTGFKHLSLFSSN